MLYATRLFTGDKKLIFAFEEETWKKRTMTRATLKERRNRFFINGIYFFRFLIRLSGDSDRECKYTSMQLPDHENSLDEDCFNKLL